MDDISGTVNAKAEHEPILWGEAKDGRLLFGHKPTWTEYQHLTVTRSDKGDTPPDEPWGILRWFLTAFAQSMRATNTPPKMQLGDLHLWLDHDGHMRIKRGDPASIEDGEIVLFADQER